MPGPWDRPDAEHDGGNQRPKAEETALRSDRLWLFCFVVGAVVYSALYFLAFRFFLEQSPASSSALGLAATQAALFVTAVGLALRTGINQLGPGCLPWAGAMTAAVVIAGFRGALSSNLWPIGLALIAIVIFPPIWSGWSLGVIHGRIRSRQSPPLRLVAAAVAGLALWVSILLFF